MDGDEMRRGNFFRRNQYKIAAVCIAAAVMGLAAAYMLTGEEAQEEKKQQVAVKKAEEDIKKEVAQKKKEAQKEEKKEKEEKEQKEETKSVSTVIHPRKEDVIRQVGTDVAAEEKEEKEEPRTVETAKIQNASSTTELHFDTEAGLLWPVDGAVILDYSMDKTIYFATLDQYKYNPAVIISGNVNDQVKAAASGKITDISTNEVTGLTVTMDLGDGYTAVYGQMKEVPYEVGAYLEAGNSIGFVSEPTKYYSMEGSNLYFAMEKDGTPLDPVDYFQ